MIIGEENPQTCVGTLCELFYLHGQEVIGPSLNIDLIAMASAIRLGLTRFFVAREDSGAAVGYIYTTIYASPMECTKKIADIQAIYVKPAFRGRTSVNLIKCMEEKLKADGISAILMRTPGANIKQAKMFMKDKMGYDIFEYTLKKEL